MSNQIFKECSDLAIALMVETCTFNTISIALFVVVIVKTRENEETWKEQKDVALFCSLFSLAGFACLVRSISIWLQADLNTRYEGNPPN